MNNENLLSKAGELHARRGDVREIAAIDLGSNSFHMIVARIVNGTLQVLSRLKQKVQLAEGLDENQVLSQAAIERGVNCLALFAERLQGFPAENVSVVGTYTLRRAINNEEFFLTRLTSSAAKPKLKPFMPVFATPNRKWGENLSLILVADPLR